MKFKKINNTGIQIGLYILFTVSALEIIIYFFYIYKPASQIFDSNHIYPLEIPTVSQILKPIQLTNEGISLADTQKSFSATQLTKFKTIIDTKLADKNTFIKDSSIDYIIAGTINSLSKTSDKSITVSLKNSTGAETSESFSEADLKQIKVSLITISPTTPGRIDAKLEDAKPGDSLIIKYSTSLLDESTSIKTEVEIYRSLIK